MKTSHAFALGLGLSIAVGLPAYFSVRYVQNVEAEAALARAEAKQAEAEREAAEKAQQEAEEKARAEQLEQQREIAIQIAREQAEKELAQNTAVAWEQFITVIEGLEKMSVDDSVTPDRLFGEVASKLDAIPIENVDSKVIPVIQSLESTFSDAEQMTSEYISEAKALVDRAPNDSLSALASGCSLATDALKSDSFVMNLLSCVGGGVTGAGLADASSQAAIEQMADDFDADMEAILDRLVPLEEDVKSTASYLMATYQIETPDEFLE